MHVHVRARAPRAIPRSERLQQRVTPEVKELLQQAADLSGRSLSDFIIGSAQEVAERKLVERRVITLTAEDSRVFAEAILNPAPANEKLRAAMRRHRPAMER